MKSLLELCAIYAILALMCGLSACADSPRENASYMESAFQAAHLVDIAQSFHGAASDPCYTEADPVTKRLTGMRPSQAGVVAWGVGYGALHYGVAKLLLDNDHPNAALVWEAVTLGDTLREVKRNVSIGIRIGAPNTDSYRGIGCPYPGSNAK
jgi:hypothetical protein